MTATWESHEGEEQLHVIAQSPEEVVIEAVGAFSRLVERDQGGEPALHELVVEAADRSSLLVDLLQELIYLADTEGFVTDEVAVAFDDGRLRAALRGRRTVVDPLVKAATYHDLSFEQQGESWHARVVLDV